MVPQGIQSARQSSELGPPPPHPQARVAPPSLGKKWGRHTRLRGRVWGTNSDEATDTLYNYYRVDSKMFILFLTITSQKCEMSSKYPFLNPFKCSLNKKRPLS